MASDPAQHGRGASGVRGVPEAASLFPSAVGTATQDRHVSHSSEDGHTRGCSFVVLSRQCTRILCSIIAAVQC